MLVIKKLVKNDTFFIHITHLDSGASKYDTLSYFELIFLLRLTVYNQTSLFIPSSIIRSKVDQNAKVLIKSLIQCVLCIPWCAYDYI